MNTLRRNSQPETNSDTSGCRSISLELAATLARLAADGVRMLDAIYDDDSRRTAKNRRVVRKRSLLSAHHHNSWSREYMHCSENERGAASTGDEVAAHGASECADSDVRVLVTPDDHHVKVTGKANTGVGASVEAYTQMARRRFQDPKPVRRGAWWTVRVRQDALENGKHRRVLKRVRLAPATMPEREVRKVVAEYLRPLNQGLETIGSATNFQHYVETTYRPVMMPGLARSTQGRTDGVIRNYLIPAFGALCLRDLSRLCIQRYFSEMAGSQLAHESKDKIRDVLSSILGSAVDFGLLVKNPVEAIRLPVPRRGRKRSKPIVTPQQFDALLELIAEPYASMVYVAVYTGLRVSELCALRWRNVHESSISIEERFCRGDWGAPKSEASNATIAVNHCVIARIHRLKGLTVALRAGSGTQRYKAVKSDGPDDLVFQGVRTGSPMRDNNILTRHIKPAARKIGLGFVNWRCLRTSHATWLKLAGADVKDAQAQMRHSRASTTLDIYQQFVPESQHRVVDRLSTLSQVVQ